MHILTATQPVARVIDDPATPEPLRQRLQVSQQIRQFASTHLHLPHNASYTRWADLQRPYVVWNVVAAPADSLQLHNWCYPVVGCVGYRGYFQEADAQEQARRLRATGLDVHVYGVPAYSTLGWLNWLGGDPLLNTFVGGTVPDVAALVFHELAHQQLYVQNDTAFNEAFATAVQRIGTVQWLQEQGDNALLHAWKLIEQRRAQWRALTQSTRKELAAVYANAPTTEIAARKEAVLQDFRARYAQMRDAWTHTPFPALPPAVLQWLRPLNPSATPYAQTDQWVEQANNASFAALAAYDDWVPAFEHLYRQQAGDWQRFYDAARALADLPKAQRQAALCALLPSDSHHPDCV